MLEGVGEGEAGLCGPVLASQQETGWLAQVGEFWGQYNALVHDGANDVVL